MELIEQGVFMFYEFELTISVTCCMFSGVKMERTKRYAK